MIDVAGNVERVRQRVSAAAVRAGRRADEIRIIAVAKTKPAALIREAHAAGLRDVGENYVQEATVKRVGLTSLPVTWHLIGHLQRNKAKRAVELFDMVQTVDTVGVAQALDRCAAQSQRLLPVLIEVNLGGEASKHGVAAENAAALLDEMASLSNLRIEGLMTIPPPVDRAEESRPAFRRLRELRDRLRRDAPANASLCELSMGMTDDYEVAIEEGATMVRIGRAIFGERGLPA